MAATIISPTPTPGATVAADAPVRTGVHRLVILHAEHDRDETLVEFAGRVGEYDRVTLASLRPIAEGIDDLLDLRIAARSRLLDEMGIAHDAVTATYVRSAHHAASARGLRNAIGRLSHHARADEVVVGPGAILEFREPTLPA
ncbi:MAG: hypothetical protein R2707_00445 [Acidimicrobiales bacterium]